MAWPGEVSIWESTTTVIRCPPGVVWDYVSDLARTPTWRTNVASIQPPEELREGARFSGTTRLLGRTWRWVLEVTHLETGRELGYVVVQGAVTPYVSYLVEADPEGTRFTMAGGMGRVGLVGRLLRPVALPALRRETQAHVARLKVLLESDGRLDTSDAHPKGGP
jgi:hypothetical protein